MRLNLEQTEIELTGDSPCFRETPYEGQNMVFVVTPLDRNKFSRASDANTKHGRKGRTKLDELGFQTSLFVACVKSWRNIDDQHGNPLPCDDENKKMLATKFMTLAGCVVDGASDEGARMDDAQEALVGNSATSSTGD